MSPMFANFGWTEDADALLRQRLTHTEIAAIVGCSTKAVQRRKRKLGIPRTQAKWKCPVTHEGMAG